MNEFESRIAALAAQLPDGTDGALITSQISRRYLTGLDCDSGWLIADRAGCVFVTDFRYTEAARAAIDFCDVVEYASLESTLGGLCRDRGLSRVVCERSRVTVAEFERLREALDPAELSASGELDAILSAARECKTDSELSAIRSAQVITEQAYNHLLGFVREGVSERDLALELEYFMRARGASRVSFDPIIASGENSSMPHAVPGTRKIRKGDLITMDIGCVVGDYCSDMTRTVAFGEPGSRKRQVYETVRQAQRAARDYLAAGGDDRAACDAAARSIIADAGFGKCFGHSLGHGVGLEIHEAPTLSPKSSGIIHPGSVVTVEPGIYLPGEFGVRIEDMMYKTEDSAVNLCSLSHELLVL